MGNADPGLSIAGQERGPADSGPGRLENVTGFTLWHVPWRAWKLRQAAIYVV